MADQARAPYGERSLQEVRDFSEAIARYLVGRGAAPVVIACNTASAAACAASGNSGRASPSWAWNRR